MNANQIAWGIELETTLPDTDTTPIGGYHRGLPVAWLPTGWTAERDSSIRPQIAGRKGCEFVSPKLRGYEGLDEVMRAVDAIRQHNARVNHTTGIHVTVEFNADAAALARLISLVANHEKGFYASTGTKHRERNMYSKQIKEYGNHDDAKQKCERDRPEAGQGETELNRLFYRLGWTRGWYKGVLRDKRYGELRAEGQTPEWKAVKRKLLEMARKYDGQA